MLIATIRLIAAVHRCLFVDIWQHVSCFDETRKCVATWRGEVVQVKCNDYRRVNTYCHVIRWHTYNTIKESNKFVGWLLIEGIEKFGKGHGGNGERYELCLKWKVRNQEKINVPLKLGNFFPAAISAHWLTFSGAAGAATTVPGHNKVELIQMTWKPGDKDWGASTLTSILKWIHNIH